MRLHVQYTAQLRSAVGRSDDEINLPDGSNVAELLVYVAMELPREAAGYILTSSGELQPSLLVAVNNRAISAREADSVSVNHGDIVTLLTPIAGG